ncbi:MULTISPECIES: response regulator transcription factor [Nesterenkonia]|uniref:DNA-binding response OmpR family regulator n=1 Tax=Nesterenkonia xinjiangensis TaxID=225327 RepID=A0A7Z0GL64_9MICC|nr:MULTISPECIES: response regulator transcription factor [Nesterenkonia]MDZ5078731.1 response regulator transcription factor [Nesterenkonia sp. HG001]NYJ76888.1 DNA-binding response OmpR family regulator [Nesterenkonia xinjiangensis]
MSRILIVEDEDRISAFVAKGLQAAGFESQIARSGTEAIVQLANAHFDLVILDLGLPQMNGFEVLEKLRSGGSAVPVIILTARSSVEDTVQGLSSGAQDYMAKPFRVEELVARVRLRLRPVAQTDEAAAEITELEHAGLRLDLQSRQASVEGRGVELSAREFALAEVLLDHPRQVLSRDQLLDMVWESGPETSSNVVDVYIRYLRTKLGAERIVTVRGAGYRLATAEELARG